MKKIFVSIVLVLLSNISIYAQYCKDSNCVWDLNNSIITNIQQFPGCTVEIIYDQATCNPERCLIKIKEVRILNSNCPSQYQFTLSEYLRLCIENVLSNPSLLSQISSCPRPDPLNPTQTYEIWYKSPCWQWIGLNNPSGPPPSIVPCDEDGCCKVTYLVHYINENTLQPVRLFQQVVGLCQPNYPDCINICE